MEARRPDPVDRPMQFWIPKIFCALNFFHFFTPKISVKKQKQMVYKIGVQN